MALQFLYDGYFAGKVGIGTESPSYQLTLGGNAVGSTEGLRINDPSNVAYGAHFSFSDTPNEVWIGGITNNTYNSAIGIHREATRSVTIDVNNNVGIGITSPGAKLEVAVADSSSILELTRTGSASFSTLISDVGAGAAQLWFNADTDDTGFLFRPRDSAGDPNNAFFIAPNGNVGIGTTSPTSNLDIFSAGTSTLTLSYDGGSGTGSTIDFSLINAGVSQPITTQIKAIDDGAYRQNLSFLTKTSATGASTLSTRMIILADGNVGIGTTGPDNKLVIADDSGAGLEFIPQTSNDRITLLGYDRTASTYQTIDLDASELHFNISGTEKMRITSAGGISFGSTGTAYGTSGQILKSNGNASPTWIDGSAIPGVPAGSGTVNTVAMWTPDGDTLGDSPITISGNDITSSGRGIIENTTNLTTGVVDSLLIKTLSSGTSITNGFGAGLSFYLENTVYSVVNEVAKISVIETDTIAIDDKMVFSVKDNNTLAERLTLTGSEAVFTGNVGIGVTVPTEKLHLQSTTSGCFIRFADQTASGVYVGSRNNELEIYAGNSERMGIDATGVVRFNAYGTGILQTDTNGVISASLSPLVDGITFNNGASITNQINTDVDTGTETVASVAIATYTAAFFDFVIKKTTNVRSGTVYACHDGTSVAFTETSTQDLGDTSDVTLSVDISGGSMRLRATTTSDDWSVKSLIRAI